MYLIVKRILDVIFCVFAILLAIPIFIVLILLLRLTGEGEVFYLQKRIGLNRQYFNIFKFATMMKNSLNLGSGSITLRDDPRVTPLGGYLRKSKLNELPQLFNILKGDMSFVGPRPLVDRTFDAYSNEIKEVIYNAKPGITGVGSLVFRDEEKWISESAMAPEIFYKEIVAPYKGNLELWYLDNRRLSVDIVLVLLTVWYVINSNSELLYKIYPSLPSKPDALQNIVNKKDVANSYEKDR